MRRIAVQNREIHRQMAELKRRKEEFDTITSNMQEGLLVMDGEGIFFPITLRRKRFWAWMP